MEPWKEFLKTIESKHVQAILSMFRTSYDHDKLIENMLKPYNISHEQYSILKILGYQHPDSYSLKEIQERLLNQTPNATRLVEKLRKKDLLNSVQNPTNRRQLNIGITQNGLDLLKKVDVPMDAIRATIEETITQEEAEQLIKILTKIQDINTK